MKRLLPILLAFSLLALPLYAQRKPGTGRTPKKIVPATAKCCISITWEFLPDNFNKPNDVIEFSFYNNGALTVYTMNFISTAGGIPKFTTVILKSEFFNHTLQATARHGGGVILNKASNPTLNNGFAGVDGPTGVFVK